MIREEIDVDQEEAGGVRVLHGESCQCSQLLLKCQAIVQAGEGVGPRLFLRPFELAAHIIHLCRHRGQLLYQFLALFQRVIGRAYRPVHQIIQLLGRDITRQPRRDVIEFARKAAVMPIRMLDLADQGGHHLAERRLGHPALFATLLQEEYATGWLLLPRATS